MPSSTDLMAASAVKALLPEVGRRSILMPVNSVSLCRWRRIALNGSSSTLQPMMLFSGMSSNRDPAASGSPNHRRSRAWPTSRATGSFGRPLPTRTRASTPRERSAARASNSCAARRASACATASCSRRTVSLRSVASVRCSSSILVVRVACKRLRRVSSSSVSSTHFRRSNSRRRSPSSSASWRTAASSSAVAGRLACDCVRASASCVARDVTSFVSASTAGPWLRAFSEASCPCSLSTSSLSFCISLTASSLSRAAPSPSCAAVVTLAAAASASCTASSRACRSSLMRASRSAM
mmetsp:Transcript_7585/g.26715  ORF Transcript_7585/g.26715 Transcript_7585/m.26715 type:complete len:296 (-) Transcript_7585:2077-2964(-)